MIVIGPLFIALVWLLDNILPTSYCIWATVLLSMAILYSLIKDDKKKK